MQGRGALIHWTGNVLVVRDATHKDRHPMRFVVAIQHDKRGTYKNKSLPRHVPSIEAGIAIAKEIELRDLVSNPAIEIAKKATGPASKSSVSLARFVCVAANPVAQVWLCISDVAVPRGRKSKEGAAPAQTKMPHRTGEYLVMFGDEPLIDREQMIAVFPRRIDAEETASDFYYVTPEDERFYDLDDSILYRNRNYEVLFSPNVSIPTPFCVRHTASGQLVQRKMKEKVDAELAAKFPDAFVPPRPGQIGEDPVRFKGITGAVAFADELDRDHAERVGGGFAARLNSWLTDTGE